MTVGTPSRVRIEWADNAIQKHVTSDRQGECQHGLATPAVYYIGHAMGDIDGNYRVTNNDLLLVRPLVSPTQVSIRQVHDVIKIHALPSSDLTFIRPLVTPTILLNNITIPIAGSIDEGSDASGPTASSAD